MSAEAAPRWDEDLGPEPGAGQDRHHDERYVRFAGLRIYVREQGDGYPLLMINGLGGNAEMWGPSERALADVARTIVFEAPGMGRSRPAPAALPLPLVARMLGRLLDELGHERVDVVGYSLGGVMAQQLARSAPQRVRRLALVATSGGWGSAPPDAMSLALISTPLRYFSPSVYRATSHLLDGGDRFRDPELKRAQAAARSSHPPSVLGYTHQFMQGSTWSSLHWGRCLKMPTLVISGERDRLTPPANGMLLAHQIPNSRLHVLPGEGHLMLFDPQSAAIGLLADFFASPMAESSIAWASGEQVVDRDEVERALQASCGVPPLKALNRVYRAWVGTPVVRRVFGAGA